MGAEYKRQDFTKHNYKHNTWQNFEVPWLLPRTDTHRAYPDTSAIQLRQSVTHRALQETTSFLGSPEQSDRAAEVQVQIESEVKYPAKGPAGPARSVDVSYPSMHQRQRVHYVQGFKDKAHGRGNRLATAGSKAPPDPQKSYSDAPA
jgi:hypothetical protein